MAKNTRKKHCPEEGCGTKLIAKGLGKNGYVECPKCGFREKYIKRGRIKRYFSGATDTWLEK